MIDRFDAADAMIFGISPDLDSDRVSGMVEEEELTFPVLYDPDNGVTKAYGILNEKSGKVPHPTVIFIDDEGVIRWFHLDEDYTRRPSPETVLEAAGAPTE